MYNRDEMLDFLRSLVCGVQFIKANGDFRDMMCTLNETLIPEESLPKTETTPRKENLETIRVYDIRACGWRSFRVESVIKFETL